MKTFFKVCFFLFLPLITLIVIDTVSGFRAEAAIKHSLKNLDNISNVQFSYITDNELFGLPITSNIYETFIIMNDGGTIAIRGDFDHPETKSISIFGHYSLHRSCSGKDINEYIDFVNFADKKVQDRLGIHFNSTPEMIGKYREIEEQLSTWHLKATTSAVLKDYENPECIYSKKRN